MCYLSTSEIDKLRAKKKLMHYRNSENLIHEVLPLFSDNITESF